MTIHCPAPPFLRLGSGQGEAAGRAVPVSANTFQRTRAFGGYTAAGHDHRTALARLGCHGHPWLRNAPHFDSIRRTAGGRFVARAYSSGPRVFCSR